MTPAPFLNRIVPASFPRRREYWSEGDGDGFRRADKFS